jgi:hypothetical protein
MIFLSVKAVTVYGPAFGYKIPGLFFIFYLAIVWTGVWEEWRKHLSVDEYRLAGVQEKLDLV